MQTLLWVSLSSGSLAFSFQLVPDMNTSGTDAWFQLIQKCLYQVLHQLRNSPNSRAMFYLINLSFVESLPAWLELCRLLLLPQLMRFCGAPQESQHPPCPELLLTRPGGSSSQGKLLCRERLQVQPSNLLHLVLLLLSQEAAPEPGGLLIPREDGDRLLAPAQGFQVSRKSLSGKQTPGESLGQQLGGSEADLLV